jgi:hypothetical protein
MTINATSLVLPTDNAVIDYSIISQMISVINNQQSLLNEIKKVLGISSTDTNGTKVVGGVANANKNSKIFNVSVTGFTNVTSAIAIPFGTTNDTNLTCWMTDAPSGNAQTWKMTFHTSKIIDKIYYIVVGTA